MDLIFTNIKSIGILYQGDCEKSRQISTGLHILINILSTILPGASNYMMQCLHSPTRAEVDKAHAQRKWGDIGIPSWRNRRWVSGGFSPGVPPLYICCKSADGDGDFGCCIVE